MTIQNQPDRTFSAIHEPADELAHLGASDPAFNDHEAQLALGADGRQQV